MKIQQIKLIVLATLYALNHLAKLGKTPEGRAQVVAAVQAFILPLFGADVAQLYGKAMDKADVEGSQTAGEEMCKVLASRLPTPVVGKVEVIVGGVALLMPALKDIAAFARGEEVE